MAENADGIAWGAAAGAETDDEVGVSAMKSPSADDEAIGTAAKVVVKNPGALGWP